MCDIWKRKRCTARPGWQPSPNTSQRGFQKAWPVNAAIVFLLLSHRAAKHLAWSVHKSFLLASKISAFNTLSVWGEKSEIGKDVVWSVEVFGHLGNIPLREVKGHGYQVSMGDPQIWGLVSTYSHRTGQRLLNFILLACFCFILLCFPCLPQVCRCLCPLAQIVNSVNSDSSRCR